jgi:hypothetical protein
MKHINQFEGYFYHGNSENEPASSTKSFLSLTPNLFRRELTSSVKQKLNSLDPDKWERLGPIIEKINFLCQQNSLDWKNYMRKSSKISSASPEDVIVYFESLLSHILEETVFADLAKDLESKYRTWGM